MKQMNILDEVETEWRNWQPNKKPGLSPPLMAEFIEGYESDTKNFIATMDIIQRSKAKISSCSASFEFARQLGKIYYDITGENIENVNYQEDKWTVSMKLKLLIPRFLSDEFHKYMVLKSLPFDCCFFKEGYVQDRHYEKWVSGGPGATKFGFYLIKIIGVRL